MDKQTFYTLLDKYRDGTASVAEQTLVEAYYRRLEMAGTTELSPEEEAALKETMYAQVLTSIKTEPGKTVSLKWRWLSWTAAAAVLLLISAGSYYLLFNKKTAQAIQTAQAQPAHTDLPPGRNAAVLTLADGKTIILDSSNGTISNQGGVTVINMSGMLSYEKEEKSIKNNQPLYNTVTTARGNQYQLVLADGSKVWLNSASSLRFPTVFTGDTREVELNGEGYFEVAKNPARPFVVAIGANDGGRVEVLGTHFNVNCYHDEETVRTTLLEGKVKYVNSASETAILKPGEQAIAQQHASLTIDHSPDLNKVMAWKNGWFEFDKTDLKTIMRQISRWYDVDIVYAKTPGQEKFGGRIGKNLNLSNILKVLEAQDVHCRLDGKKLIVE